MKRSLGTWLAALVAGFTFGIGLAVSGMTRPSKVIGFLDVGGDFDPSLLATMGGAVVVYAVALRIVRRRTPLFAEVFHGPDRRDIDPKLLVGATLFGIGWALGGYCPGPAIVGLGSSALGPFVFVAAMLAGWLATARLEALAVTRNASRHVGNGARSRRIDVAPASR